MTLSSGDLEKVHFSDDIPRILTGVSNTRGEDFFLAVTKSLAGVIRADFTFISRLNPDLLSVSTLAFCEGNEPRENFDYDLLDTPCQDVMGEDTCIYPENICGLYPRDILLQQMGIEGYIGAPLLSHDGKPLGVVCALYKNKIDRPDVASNLFQVFAGRISAEIENFELQKSLRASMDALKEYRGELEHKVEQRTTELVAAMDRAEKANEIKGNFLAKMSHEIRTPISGVLGMAELMGDTALDDDQQLYLDTMASSGKLLLSIVNDILDYSKIEAGKVKLEQIPVAIRDLVNSLVLPFKLAPTPGVTMGVTISQDVPEIIETDPTRLQQLVGNLLSNAFKFTREGQVALSVTLDDEQRLVFSVQDTGIGIAADKIKHLFDPFVQADESITRKFGGTGLGLCVCQGLVKIMHGELNVESTLGSGAHFYFTLPLVCPDNPPLAPALEAVASTGKLIKDLKVLIAEDNSVNRMVIEGLLKRAGVKADMVENGQQAVETVMANKGHYDVVFMDCEMPVLDGLSATRQIRAWESEHNQERVAIFALTAHVLPYLVAECTEAGMDGHLSKPIETALLDATLQSLISSQRR